MKKGFTLLELLIVMAVLAILASILLVVVKPQQIFQKARDTQRKTDLRNVSTAIEVYLVEGSSVNLTADGTTNNSRCVGGADNGGTGYIYYSTAAGSGTSVGTFPVVLAPASPTLTNGNGWLHINFAGVSTLNLASLPIDPSNTANNINPPYYYTFACRSNNSYELNANLEIMASEETSDGGNFNGVYEVGTDKTILPSAAVANFYPGQ